MRLKSALRDPTPMLVAILSAAGLVQSWDLGRRSPGLDFHQFWAVAEVAGRADVPSIYEEEARARIGAEFVRRSLTDEDSERRRAAARPWQVLEPTATPLLYAAFRPLSGGSYEHAYLVFRTLSLAAAAAGVIALALLLGHSAATALLMLAVVTLAFRPLKADVQVGNVNALQLAAIAGYLWLSSRRDGARAQLAAGALLAALVLFKPNLLAALPLLAVTWVTRGRHRKLALQAAGAGVGALGALALTAAVFGSLLVWRDWFDYLSALPPAKIPLRFGNVGLARLLYETTDLHLTPYLAVLFTGLALTCVWVGRPPGSAASEEAPSAAAGDDTAALGAGCLAYLLSAPLVWLHYLLLALPAVLLLLRGSKGGDGAIDIRRPLAALALVAIAIDPIADLFGMYDLSHQAVLTSAGLLVLFALTLREIAHPRPAVAAPGARDGAMPSYPDASLLAQSDGPDYLERLTAEGRKWGGHLAVEASREMNAWLDHPSVCAHYAWRRLIDGLSWREWVQRHFDGPANRSMELGCGSAGLSLELFKLGSTREIEGVDVSPERIREAEAQRAAVGAPGGFYAGDGNRVSLEPSRYDLIVSSHSFHHFLELERVMEEVHRALTPRGLFILEEFVGPTQFQWTDAQIEATKSLTALIPERYRKLRWGAVKPYEGRPTVQDVVAASPFESIRSAEIVPLFEKYFCILHRMNLGGTIQHLLYNGIMHNFVPGDPEAERLLSGIWQVEDGLVDSGLLPSDFQLLIGKRRDA